MFDKAANKQPKREAAVTVALVDGERFDGAVFLKYDERVIDLLNDKRSFIPVKRDTGATVIVAKSNIASLQERAPDPDEVKAAPEADAAADKADAKAKDTAPKAEAEAPSADKPQPKAGKGPQSKADMKEDRAEAEDAKDADAAEEKAVETDAERRARKKKNDLYKVLRISPDATLEEVRAAYKARMKAVHPDTMVGQDIDEEKKRAALQATQLVNRAYRAILADREREAEAAE